MPPAERLSSARHLAGTARGDMRTATSIHYGRLAGFSSLKDEHFDKDLRWGWLFVLYRQSRGIVCSRAQEEKNRTAREATEQAALRESCPARRRSLRSRLPEQRGRRRLVRSRLQHWASGRRLKAASPGGISEAQGGKPVMKKPTNPLKSNNTTACA